jgi:transposase
MLLPADLRQWVPEDDLVHFVINAVETMRLPALRVNERGSGSKQYPPRMMLALLIYCYANGLFGSRRIERATYRDVAVRYLTGDTHPDHDTICAFRRENGQAVKQAFAEVVGLARQMGLLKLGTVSVDGTHIKANASKHKSVRYDRAGELEKLLRKDIEERLARAEKADRQETEDEQKLPQEIARREALLEKMRWAREELEKRARSDKEQGQHKDEPPGPPSGGNAAVGQPRDSQQINLTDPDSSLMRKSHRDSYEQAYNAQAVVEADGSQLILATDVLATPSDANELPVAWEKVVQSVGPVQRMLADGGYVNAEDIGNVGQKVDLYVAIARADNSYRRYDFRPRNKQAAKKLVDPRLRAMRKKVTSEEGRRIYRRRAATVEPVFGTIKAALGLRQFLLRGIEKVRIEWDLVCLAYNTRRLWSLSRA